MNPDEKMRENGGAPGDWPFVSVIMPVRNEADFIERSLGAVLAQDYPSGRLEILVVDGMSRDGTREMVARLAERSRRFPVVILDNPDHIVSPALNKGLERAKGEIIIRVDGHCEIPPDYVRRCVAALEKTGADCVGGILVTVGQTRLASAIALAQSSFFGVGGVSFRMTGVKARFVDTVAFGAYRREVFRRIGDFDEELVRNQDDEFNLRLIQSGGKIWLDPSIRTVYYSRATLRSLWRQYFQYGFYKVRVIQKRGKVPSWRHLVPAAFVAALAVSLGLALVTRRACWGFMVIVLYAAASLAAGLWTARRNWRTLPLLPAVFATLHVAYGLGFLWGLWRWRGKWKKN